MRAVLDSSSVAEHYGCHGSTNDPGIATTVVSSWRCSSVAYDGRPDRFLRSAEEPIEGPEDICSPEDISRILGHAIDDRLSRTYPFLVVGHVERARARRDNSNQHWFLA